MSHKIKPEDVPIDFIAKHLKGRLFAESVYEADILVIINAAIEAGLVSPPCKADRDTMGKLIKSPIGTIRLSPGKPVMSSQEHWKGQTE